jgi:predicted lipoprotein with Yx(FWY)xxD motif
MKRFQLLGTAIFLIAIPASSVLAQDATPSPEAEISPSVYVREDPVLGQYLSDPTGMTLYRFTNDTVAGESTCLEECAATWPPFGADEPLALPDGVEGELTLVERSDGAAQLAYNGIPLYYRLDDEEPGDITGQGVDDAWWIVAPNAQIGAVATPIAPTSIDRGTPISAGDVTVIVTEFFVQSAAATFQVGEEYTFDVTNIGDFPHQFYIEAAGASGVPLEADGDEAAIEQLDPGESATLVWTFSEPGNYQLACHLPGHYPRGMALNVKVLG